MNINEEGKYYASMVSKFRNEYKSKNLQGFCKDQKVSYTKMLHCLRYDSYRKPKADPIPIVEELGLHPLVVEAADNKLLRKKLRARNKRVEEIESMVRDLNHQLDEKVDQIADMMQKLVSFMIGEGNVTLSDSLRDAVVADVRTEFQAREKKLKETYAKEIERMTSVFNAQLAAKQNEINALKGIDDGDAPTTVDVWA